jgi:hypothetical protein
MHSLARFAPLVFALAVTLAPAKPLPACTPAQRETWPITDRNTIVEGRTILIHTSPDGTRRCGEVQVSTARPTGPKKVRK